MIRFLIATLCLFCILSVPMMARAQTDAPEVPQMSFAHQVDIVVTAKRDPRILEMKITQEKADILIQLIVDQNQNHEKAKEIAHNVIMITKALSLDDKPADTKQPGKGLYHYKLTMTRPDGVMLLTATKAPKKKTIRFENPVPELSPLTRAGVNGQ